MKHKTFFLRYLCAALLCALCAALVLVGCKDNSRLVKWEIAEHATVHVEGYEALPESVEEDTKLTFTVTCDSGYTVDSVKNGDRKMSPTDGKYQFTVAQKDVTITVTVKREIESVQVTSKPAKMVYEAGDVLDKTGMVVEAVYVGGDKETVKESDYRIHYNGNAAASSFSLGDEYFTVVYDGKESDRVQLDEKVQAVVTVDTRGGLVADAYLNRLKENTKLTVTEPDGKGVFKISFAEPLEEDLALPTVSELVKNHTDPGAFTLMGYNNPFVVSRPNGDSTQNTPSDIIPVETVKSGTVVARWQADLFTAEEIKYEAENGKPMLVLSGSYHIANSVYFYFYEGNRQVSFESSEVLTKPAEGGATTIKFDMSVLAEAEAQDGGTFLGAWLDLKLRSTDFENVDYEEQEFPFYLATNEPLILGDYTYTFAEYSGALKTVITPRNPTTYQIKNTSEGENLSVTFEGVVDMPRYFGKTIKIDVLVGSRLNEVYGKIGDDGKWSVKFDLTSENFAFNTSGYVHMIIVESEDDPTVLYTSNTNVSESNLANAALTGEDYIDCSGIDLLIGRGVRIDNEDSSEVYYFGEGQWGGIVFYALNEKQNISFDSSTQIALKVDDMENPTKVYYIFNVRVGGLEPYTEEEIKNNFVFGNVDGAADVFPCAKIEKMGKDLYRVWYDVTAYAGGQLWPNFYEVKGTAENPEYVKAFEIRNATAGSETEKLYAIVGETKYTIKVEYNGPCVVPTPLGMDDSKTNPATADPSTLPKPGVILPDEALYAPTDANVKTEGNKVYFVLSGTYTGCTAEEIKAFLEAIYVDFQHNMEAGAASWDCVTDFARTVTAADGNWTIEADITGLEISFYTVHFDAPGQNGNAGKDLKLTDLNCDGRNVSFNSRKYTITNKYGLSTAGKDFYGCIGLTITDQTAPVVTPTGADIVAESEKVYFVLSGTYENYEQADLEEALETIYFDFQFRGAPWTRYNEFDRTVTVSEETWTIKFDVTALATGNYTGHFDSTDGVGGTDDTTKNLDIADSSIDGKNATLGTKSYTLVNKPTSTEEADFWGHIGLTIADNAAKTFTATGADIVKADEKVYFVVSGTSVNYDASALETLLGSVYFDLQENGYINNNQSWDGAEWTNHADFTRTVTVEGATWKIEFDVTSLAAKAYTAHFDSTDGTEETRKDLKLSDTSMHEKAVTAGDKTYTLYNFFGSANAHEYYGCIGLRIMDAAEAAKKATIDRNSVKLEMTGDVVYLVFEGTCEGYTEQDFAVDIQETAGSWPTTSGFTTTVTIADGKFTVKADLSKAAGSANLYVLHAIIGGNTNDLDLEGKTEAADGEKIKDVSTFATSTGKTYTLYVRSMWEGRQVYVLQVTDPDAKTLSVDMNSAKLEESEGRVYFSLEGTYTGTYTSDEIKFDVQMHDEWIDVEGVTYEVTFRDGKFTLKADVTVLSAAEKPYGMHYQIGDGAKQDVQRDGSTDKGDFETIEEIDTVTLGTKTYVLKVMARWGRNIIAISVLDTSAKTVTFSGATLEQTDGKVYLVLTATVTGYTAEDLKTMTFYGDNTAEGKPSVDLTAADATLEGINATIKFEITSAALGKHYGHYTLNGESKGNINCGVTASTVTEGGKKYELTTEYGMPVLIVSEE